MDENQGDNMRINSNRNKKEILKLLRKTRKIGIYDLINYLKHETDYFTAPASTKYHLNIRGGLAQHSLNVYDCLKRIYRQFEKEVFIPESSLIIVALLHDVCKTNFYKKVPVGWVYDDQLPLGHGEKSVIILQRYIELTMQELMMIRWHMAGFDLSPYGKTAYYDATKKYPEIIIMHSADYLATSIIENKHFKKYFKTR
jgi:hypothetical protein|tara:strand:- start:995 stop:1591 length:597 start_codon:yes stop_codon:yes gene_type:complete